jgi:alkylation response protein AidB-like acyl-CoA dehydrogenase
MRVETAALSFEDSETQALLRQTAAEFLAGRYPISRLYAIESGESKVGPAELAEIRELGWLGLTVSESAGGAGLSLLEAAVILDELGYSGAPLPVAPGNAAGGALGRGGDLVTLGEERRGLSGGLRVEGGRVSGRVGLVAAADLAGTLLAPVGESLALLPLAAARLRPAPNVDLAGCFDLDFAGLPTTEIEVVANGSTAAALAERAAQLQTALRLLEAVGMMRRVVELTKTFVTDRIVFGQPVAKFQAARHRAANLFMDVEMARWAAYHGVWRLQEDAGDPGGLWLAKHWAIRATERLLVHTHMLHGGVGVTMEYPLHLFTQGLMARATRGGDLEEMVARATAWAR